MVDRVSYQRCKRKVLIEFVFLLERVVQMLQTDSVGQPEE